jgi:hypothetical protein
MENVRGTQGMTKAERKQLKKKWTSASGKDGCKLKRLSAILFFQLSCFCLLPCAFFSIAVVKLLA